MTNRSSAEWFESSYRRLGEVLHFTGHPDLTTQEHRALHHVPAAGGISLTELSDHLRLPKSTTSVLVKGLARRGFLERRRAADDERRLAIALTPEGVEGARVLDIGQLATALARLGPRQQLTLLRLVDRLADEAETG